MSRQAGPWSATVMLLAAKVLLEPRTRTGTDPPGPARSRCPGLALCRDAAIAIRSRLVRIWHRCYRARASSWNANSRARCPGRRRDERRTIDETLLKGPQIAEAKLSIRETPERTGKKEKAGRKAPAQSGEERSGAGGHP